MSSTFVIFFNIILVSINVLLAIYFKYLNCKLNKNSIKKKTLYSEKNSTIFDGILIIELFYLFAQYHCAAKVDGLLSFNLFYIIAGYIKSIYFIIIGSSILLETKEKIKRRILINHKRKHEC